MAHTCRAPQSCYNGPGAPHGETADGACHPGARPQNKLARTPYPPQLFNAACHIVCSRLNITPTLDHVHRDLSVFTFLWDLRHVFLVLVKGTVEAIKCYLRLPRRPTVRTLLHPAIGDAPVDLPRPLRRFGAAHFPATQTHPTPTIMRKWYHSGLVQRCQTEDELLALLSKVDPHKVHTTRLHYVLTTAAEDAKLAMELVKHKIGEPVPWPLLRELADDPHDNLQVLVAEEVRRATDGGGGGDNDGDNDDDDEDDDELEYFPFGECFGI